MSISYFTEKPKHSTDIEEIPIDTRYKNQDEYVNSRLPIVYSTNTHSQEPI